MARTVRTLIRFGFGMYVGAAFMLTHYPQLTLPMPGRPDLVAHMTLFGLWTLLCTASGMFGKPLSERNISRSVLLSWIYSGLDEWSQSIPFIHRHAALDDFGANALGVMAASIVLMGLALVRRRASPAAR